MIVVVVVHIVALAAGTLLVAWMLARRLFGATPAWWRATFGGVLMTLGAVNVVEAEGIVWHLIGAVWLLSTGVYTLIDARRRYTERGWR